MNQENKFPSNNLAHEKFLSKLYQKKLEEDNNEEQSSITPKRPLLSRDRMTTTSIDVSPLSDQNFRPHNPKHIHLPPTPIESIKNDQSPISAVESCVSMVSSPQSSRSSVTDDNDNYTYIPIKARPAPSTTWKAFIPVSKRTTTISNAVTEISPSIPELLPNQASSFQPAIRPRISFNLSSGNTIDKQAHAYTIWLNSLFTPIDFMCYNSTINQSISIEGKKSFKSLGELNRWYILRDHAREVYKHEIQPIATKISIDIDIKHCRINPKSELTFSPRTIHRQALLNFLSSYNRIWLRLAMEILFSINIQNPQEMKLIIDQYLLQSSLTASLSSNENNFKKFNMNNKVASAEIRLTIKNLIIIIIFLERIKILRLIDNDPCLYNYDSKFKSTKESIDVLSRDFISSDTNILRRLKLAGYEPIYKQTSLDEFNYLINKIFEDLKDGIRLTRCAQLLLSSTNEQVAKYDLSTKLKCPAVNLVHKLVNVDQAFHLFQTFGHVNLTGISNKDIVNGNKQRTLELLWRLFMTSYLPRHLSPLETLNTEIAILTQNLSKLITSKEEQLIRTDIIPLQKQDIDFTLMIPLLIKWVQLICAHYKFWLYDLQESFSDGRALLYIVSYYLPTLCDYTDDIKHITTLATCQTSDEHFQFNLELSQQQQLLNVYERNVKSNFRLLEECIKQFGTFSYDLIKYEYYAKDVPDERCTIIILAMLAHDLLYLNHNNSHEMDFRHQKIFDQLKDKYSNNSIFQEDKVNLKLSIPSDRERIHLTQSVLDTMNYDILNRIELLSDDDEDLYTYSRLRSAARIDHRRISISATMAAISLDDFIELEKTIEKEENNIDETFDKTYSIDPIHSELIQEILTLFLSQHQSITQKTETQAANIIQAYWRGYQVRTNNRRHNHPVTTILDRLHSSKLSLNLHERFIEIIRAFSQSSISSLSGYIQFLNDIEPILNSSFEIRYLIADQGLLDIFFILIKCSIQNDLPTILLNPILHILQLFTIKHDLIMKLIDKTEQINDFITILLKSYQINDCEMFQKISFLLQTIANDKTARNLLKENQLFNDTLQYINKNSIENEKQVQLIIPIMTCPIINETYYAAFEEFIQTFYDE